MLIPRVGPIALYIGGQNLLNVRQVDTSPLLYVASEPWLPAGAGLFKGMDGWGPQEGREFFVGVRFLVGGE